MNWLKKILCLCAFALLPGCAGALQQVTAALPTVIQYVQDAQMVLDAIDQAAVPVLAVKGDPDLSEKYSRLMSMARQSLQLALRTTDGTKALSEQDLDAAFSAFRDTYEQLVSLLEQAQLMNSSGTMAAMPGTVNITVVEPLAISHASVK